MTITLYGVVVSPQHSDPQPFRREIVPHGLLSLLGWLELERLVTGSASIDVALLREHTVRFRVCLLVYAPTDFRVRACVYACACLFACFMPDIFRGPKPLESP